MKAEGKRQIARLMFRVPRPARFATHEIVLHDLSMSGAGARHLDKIVPGTRGLLRFRLEHLNHEIECVMARSRLELVKSAEKTLQIYRSGLKFVALEVDGGPVRDAIRKRVQRAVLRQQADALGDPSLMVGVDESSGKISLDLLARLMEYRPYVRCTIDEKGKWTQEPVRAPDQPADGFTLSAEEEAKEVQILCRTYEKASEEQRALIRMFAHLALSEPSDEPRGRYQP